MATHTRSRWPRFPAEPLRRLFDTVDVDDIVDAHVALPDPIVLACHRKPSGTVSPSACSSGKTGFRAGNSWGWLKNCSGMKA